MVVDGWIEDWLYGKLHYRRCKSSRLIKTDSRRIFNVCIGNVFCFDCYSEDDMIYYV